MEQTYAMKIIARTHSAFSTKFGIPRQSGLVADLKATVIFEPEFRNPDAVRGLEGFSHIWLLWEFSEAIRTFWSPTVRPPRLGGNTRMGVFATRSPFRPNPLGLSSVRLDAVELNPEVGPVLHISGADLLNGTPIFDIKPYIPYADCHPDANGGFASTPSEPTLDVVLPDHLLERIPAEHRQALHGILALDPRPAYQEDPHRIYGFSFAGCDIQFSVSGSTLTVLAIHPV